MTQRAVLAQLAAFDDEATMAESMRSTRVAADECRTSWEDACPSPHDRIPTLIAGVLPWTESIPDTDDDTAADESTPGEVRDDVVDLDSEHLEVEEVDETPPSVPSPLVATRSALRPKSGASAAVPDESGPRPVTNGASAFDAVERRYRQEGRSADLVELYL